MDVIDFVNKALRRNLTSSEEEMLYCLSPNGMAKLNNDICRGIDLEQSLRELQTVFLGAHCRRQTAEAKLSEAARRLMTYMTRSPTADEMAVLSQLPADVLKLELQDRLNEGNTLDDAVEDLTFDVHRSQMIFEARHWASLKKIEVTTSRLPSSAFTSNVLAPYAVDLRYGKMSVALSPVVHWFQQPSTAALDDKQPMSSNLQPKACASSLNSRSIMRRSASLDNGSKDDKLNVHPLKRSKSHLQNGGVRFAITLSDDESSVSSVDLPSPQASADSSPNKLKRAVPSALKYLQRKVKIALTRGHIQP